MKPATWKAQFGSLFLSGHVNYNKPLLYLDPFVSILPAPAIRNQKNKQITDCTIQAGMRHMSSLDWGTVHRNRKSMDAYLFCFIRFKSSVTVVYIFLDHFIWHCLKLTHASTVESIVFWLLLVFLWPVVASWCIYICLIPCTFGLKVCVFTSLKIYLCIFHSSIASCNPY